MKREIRVLFLFALIVSCTNRKLSPADYLKYMSDESHGFVKHHKIGVNEYSIQLLTPAFVACNEFASRSFSEVDFSQRIKELDSSVGFSIKLRSISPSTGAIIRPQTILEADDAVAYYGQRAMNDITLKVGSDILHPTAYEYENNYGLSPDNTILVFFKVGDLSKDMILSINDRYRGVHNLNTEFLGKSLTGIPNLQIH